MIDGMLLQDSVTRQRADVGVISQAEGKIAKLVDVQHVRCVPKRADPLNPAKKTEHGG